MQLVLYFDLVAQNKTPSLGSHRLPERLMFTEGQTGC